MMHNDNNGNRPSEGVALKDLKPASSSEEPSETPPFVPSIGLTTAEARDRLFLYGRNELPDKKKAKWRIYCEQLIEPMPIMIWIAIVVEIGIQNWVDMIILAVIQFANASLGYYEIMKAGHAVEALKASLKPLATVKRDGVFSNIEAGGLVPGDLVLLGAGSAVPADCIINHGQLEVDQSALTGESLPVTIFAAVGSCKMGSSVMRGEVEATVEHTGVHTFLGTTAALLQGDQTMGNFEKVLINIMLILVVVSFFFCIIVFIFLVCEDAGVTDSLSFTVVLLVASIPIAIEIVCTTTLALGSKELSAHGAIVTRLAAIEDLAGMTMLCSDKTGTLTLNKMEIQPSTPVYKYGETQYSLLRYSAMACKWNEPPRDALDTLVLHSVDMASMEGEEQVDYMPFDPINKRTGGTIRIKNTESYFSTSKGAPHVIMGLITAQLSGLSARARLETEQMIKKCEDEVTALGRRGIRCIAVAKTIPKDDLNAEDVWELLGLLTFLDPPRLDTKETIRRAGELGIQVKMVTGDNVLIAMETSRMLDLGYKEVQHDTNGVSKVVIVPVIRGPDGLPVLDPNTKASPPDLAKTYGDYIRHGHGFAEVFPEHKYLIVECLRELGFKVGMTGDGVNDAPALKRADVGIAVSGATDAARAAADIVLTEDGLSTIIDGITIARCIFQRMRNFLTYRIAATVQLLTFSFVAVLLLRPRDFQPSDWQTIPGFDDEEWPQFFKLPVLMLMLITLLNDGTLISVGYDNVTPSTDPSRWNIPVLFMISTMLAIIPCISSLVLLWAGLASWQDNGFFQISGLGGLSYGQITTMLYLKVSISDFLTLFSARTQHDFFWTSMPSSVLLICCAIALGLSTILALAWPDSHPDDVYTLGLARRHPAALAIYVWLYCIVCWVLQDFFKVVLYYKMEQHNILGINDIHSAKTQYLFESDGSHELECGRARRRTSFDEARARTSSTDSLPRTNSAEVNNPLRTSLII